MHTQAVVNQKGGCGKTTTAIHLAAFLARSGFRTLLIDLDPQGHAALGLGLSEGGGSDGIYEVVMGERSLTEVLVPGPVDDLSVAPGTISLAAVEQLLSGREGREGRLKTALESRSVAESFDQVVIDCPPSLGLLTFNALWAADRVLIPLDSSIYSLDGLQRLSETIALVEDASNRTIPRDVLLTLFDRRTRFGSSLVAALQEGGEDFHLLQTRIRPSTRLREAGLLGLPIFQIDTHCNGYWDYQWLVEELLELSGHQEVIPVEETTAALEEEAVVATDTVQEGGEAEGRTVFTNGGVENPFDTVYLDTSIGPVPIQGGAIVRFKNPRAHDVKIAGNFNDWVPDRDVITRREDDGTWQKVLYVEPGTYEYRLIVDGVWEPDPCNETRVATPLGDNSVLHV